MPTTRAASTRPDLSLVMPCYNEEGAVETSVRRLMSVFAEGGQRLELVTIDNGSVDGTPEILRRLAAEFDGVVYHRLEKNAGYSGGIMAGLPFCHAPWAGIVHADGQVEAQDVFLLFESALASDGKVIAKVRRRFRMDGLKRKLISIGYNLGFRVLWPGIKSLDVNGCPKILPRQAWEAMRIGARGWCIDPEMLVKGDYLGLHVFEVNVFARKRSQGVSHVSTPVCWEFVRELLGLRFSGAWKRKLGGADTPVPTRSLKAE